MLLRISRWSIMQKVPYTSHYECTCLWARHFRFFFTPRCGFFSPFPHGTCSLSVRVGCKLRGWFPVLPTTMSLYFSLLHVCKAYSIHIFLIRGCHPLWHLIQKVSFKNCIGEDACIGFIRHYFRHLGWFFAWDTEMIHFSHFCLQVSCRDWSFLIRGPIVHIWLLASNGLSWRVPPLYPYTP